MAQPVASCLVTRNDTPFFAKSSCRSWASSSCVLSLWCEAANWLLNSLRELVESASEKEKKNLSPWDFLTTSHQSNIIMTATTRRQSALWGMPPSPSSKSLVVMNTIAQQHPLHAATSTTCLPDSKSFVVAAPPLENAAGNRETTSTPPLLVNLENETESSPSKLNTSRNSMATPSLKRRRTFPSAVFHGIVQTSPLVAPVLVSRDHYKNLLSSSSSSMAPLHSTTFDEEGAAFEPLRDLSNEEGLGLSITTINKRNVASTPCRAMEQHAKRPRLSLPHMMTSPLVSKKVTASSANRRDDCTAFAMMEQTKQLVDRKDPPKIHHKGQDDDSGLESLDKNDDTESLLPTSDQDLDEFPQVFAIPSSPDTDKLMEIRRLVHAYTALPEDSRFESNEAKAVEELSGYTLVPSFVVDGAISEAQEYERRQSIIESLQDRVKIGDSCKIRDARLIQSVTECRFGRGCDGSIEYTHVPSSRSISPQEYEERYMCMMDEFSTIRTKSWGDYFAKLGQEMKAKSTQVEKTDSLAGETTTAPSVKDSGASCEEYAAVALETAEPNQDEPEIDQDPTSTDRPVANDENTVPDKLDVPQENQWGDDMETEDEIADDPTHQQPQEAVSANDNAAAEGCIDVEISDTEMCCSPIVYKKIDRTKQKEENHAPAPPSTTLFRLPTSPDMLLPFPPCDDPSTHHLIARAENKLLVTIDDALA